MASHIIRITEISDEVLSRMDARARERGVNGRSEYVRHLILEDLSRSENAGNGQDSLPTEGRSFREILEPLHVQVEESATTDEALNLLLNDAREEVASGRAVPPSSSGASG